MCNDCGCFPCARVQLRRGPKGDRGNDGLSAQVSFGGGPPVSNLGLSYGIYIDNATDGNYWTWDPGGPWVDTGALVTGPQGDPGADGTNAFTFTGEVFVMPADNGSSQVAVTVLDTSWMSVGQMLHITDCGYMQVASIIDATHVLLLNPANAALGTYAVNLVPTDTVAIGSKVSPAGLQGVSGLAPQYLYGTGLPIADPGSQSAVYYDSTGNIWIWNGNTAGPWTDTNIPAVGPQGPTGPTGADGYTPTFTMSASPPGGGNGGDIWVQQVNPGKWQWYQNTAPAGTPSGFTWSAIIAGTLTSNRLIGYSTTSFVINPTGLPVNAGDQWWAQVGTEVRMSVWTGTAWFMVLSFTTGGGGGGSTTLSQAATLGLGDMGNLEWQMNRIIYLPINAIATSAYAISLDASYAKTSVTFNGDNANPDSFLTIGWQNSTDDAERTFDILNAGDDQMTLVYSAGIWTKNPEVSQPTQIASGQRASLICRLFQGKMNIICVQYAVVDI